MNIHYKTPVRLEEKTWIPEHQLRVQQEAVLRRIYQEERHKKYLQELRDLEMRRHQDFIRYGKWEDKTVSRRSLKFHCFL